VNTFSLLMPLSISKYVMRRVYDKKHKLMVSNCTCGWRDHELAILQET